MLKIKKNKIKSNIIAHGESGHKHVLEKGNYEIYKSLEDECLLLKILDKKTVLDHEEHDNVKLWSGNFKQDTVREYDHFKEEARKVID